MANNRYYVGTCVGGPWKGEQIVTYERTYQLARMGQVTFPPADNHPKWQEIDRGHYEYESGHWWWKGWALKR